MMYLNFDRPEWEEKIYNSFGGEDKFRSISVYSELNEVVFDKEPNFLMMAEDSSDYPLVTAPTYLGGLGFNYKWNMGWMNDMLIVYEKGSSLS